MSNNSSTSIPLMCQTIQTTISIIIRIDYYISSIAANLHTQELLQVSSAILNDVISQNETKLNSQKTSSEKCLISFSPVSADGLTPLGAKTSAGTVMTKPRTASSLQNLIKYHHYLYIVKEIHSQKWATTALVWPETLQVSSGIIVNTEINQQHL